MRSATDQERVLDDYVNSEALLTRADKLGYRVSDRSSRGHVANPGISGGRQVRRCAMRWPC